MKKNSAINEISYVDEIDFFEVPSFREIVAGKRVDLDDFLIGLLRFIKKKIFINISAVTTLMGISTAANASQDMDQVRRITSELSINKTDSANNLIVVAKKESLGEDKYLLVKVEKNQDNDFVIRPGAYRLSKKEAKDFYIQGKYQADEDFTDIEYPIEMLDRLDVIDFKNL